MCSSWGTSSSAEYGVTKGNRDTAKQPETTIYEACFKLKYQNTDLYNVKQMQIHYRAKQLKEVCNVLPKI
jgi:hypothetical protein